MSQVSVKLPKQWRHWCADQRLRQHSTTRIGKHEWMYLKGRGHYWRVNCFGDLQCGDTYAEFDRWALCDITETPMPRSREQFRSAVAALLQAKP